MRSLNPSFDAKLNELFIDLPEPPRDVGDTVAAIMAGKYLHVGGVLPFSEGRIQYQGRVGVEIKTDNARLAARLAAVNALALAQRELGGTLNRIRRVVSVTGFVACGADFKDHNKVIDGASELFVQIFGALGRHTRLVAGASSLPRSACVEIAVVFEVK